MFSLFSGFLAPKNTIPNPWIFMYYVSYYTYSIRGLAVNEYTAVGGFECPTPPQACPIPNGETALALYDMQAPESDKWNDLSYLTYFCKCCSIPLSLIWTDRL